MEEDLEQGAEEDGQGDDELGPVLIPPRQYMMNLVLYSSHLGSNMMN